MILRLFLCSLLFVAGGCTSARIEHAENVSQTAAAAANSRMAALIFPPQVCSVEAGRQIVNRLIEDAHYGKAQQNGKLLRGNGYNWQMWAVNCERPLIGRVEALVDYFLVESAGEFIMAKGDKILKSDDYGGDFGAAIDSASEVVKHGSSDAKRLAKALLAVSNR
jgi:hypothetical protein